MSGKKFYGVSKNLLDLSITEEFFSTIKPEYYKYFEKKQEAIIYLGNLINNNLIFHKKAVLEYRKI